MMRYIFVKQHDATDCAAACLAMICTFYRKEVSITTLRDALGTNYNGTNLLGIKNGAEKLGFNCRIAKTNRIEKTEVFRDPFIANILNEEGIGHYVTIFKITKKHVVVGDPADSLKRYTIEEFNRLFTGYVILIKPNNEFVIKNTGSISMQRRFLNLILPQKKLLCYSVLASLLVTALGIILALFNKIIVDEVLPYNLKDMLVMVFIIFVVITVVKVLVDFLRCWMTVLLSQKIDIPLILSYFKHVLNVPMKFFSTRKSGEILTRFSDAMTIKDIFTNIGLIVITDGIMTLITGSILFGINRIMFIAIILIVAINTLLMIIFKKPYRDINILQMQRAATLNSEIIESLHSIESIKTFAKEELQMEQIEKKYISFLRANYREGILSSLQAKIAELTYSIGRLLIMFLGVRLVIKGEITFGTTLAFLSLSEFFLQPISNIVEFQLHIQEASISMERLSEIMDYEEEDDSYKESINSINVIEFDKVSFDYGQGKKAVENISLCIKKGEKIAIVGESGSGKSTLAKLLLKYYDTYSGSIKVNGIDIKHIANKNLRNQISYVPQNIELFSKSIFENIQIGKPDSNINDIKKAAGCAEAHQFIQSMPLNYFTILEESGNGLSGGEKQRIAIARAILKNTDTFILDEPTTSLDNSMRRKIMKKLMDLCKYKTIIVITHQLLDMNAYTKIIVVDKGAVIEEGTHEELIRKGGRYATLWKQQDREEEFSKNNDILQDEEKASVDLNDEEVITYK